MIEALLARIDLGPEIARAARAAQARTGSAESSQRADIAARVLAAFLAEGISESDLAGTYGYGYDDAAREHYESLLARVLGAEKALARLSLVSGTSAIVTTIAACLPSGGSLLAATGRPYDTLHNALCDAPHSLVAQGARYGEVPRTGEGGPDLEAIAAAARDADVVFVQRSRGYAPQRSLSSEECGVIAKTVHKVEPRAFVLVDNCYGELVETSEPTHHGADAVIGSLIKNLGGTLAPGGAYVAGRADVIERVAARHYAPGLGPDVGPSFGFGRQLLQGLFLAPLIVSECLAGLDFTAALFEELGYRVYPRPGEVRRDVVQAIALGDAAKLVAFSRGLQRAMPLNARFAPEPGPVPGYPTPVVMSSGAFVPGSTLELSCDAPLRPPYEVYVQGGSSRFQIAAGALLAAAELSKESK